MKNLFYSTTILSLLLIVVGVLRFENFRDRLYLGVMALMFLAIISGLMYLVRKD